MITQSVPRWKILEQSVFPGKCLRGTHRSQTIVPCHSFPLLLTHVSHFPFGPVTPFLGVHFCACSVTWNLESLGVYTVKFQNMLTSIMTIGLFVNVALLVSQGCWNKVPQTGCLKIYCLTILEAKSMKSKCLQNRGPLRLWVDSFLFLVSGDMPAIVGYFLTYRSITPISAFIFHGILLMCTSVSISKLSPFIRIPVMLG